MVESLIAASRKRAASVVECIGFGLLSGLTLAGIALAAWGAREWAAVAGFALAALLGGLLLHALRRARVAGERFALELDEHNRRWKKELTRQVKARTRGLKKDGQGQVAKTPTRGHHGTGSRLLSNYLRLADAMPDSRWLDDALLSNASTSGRDLLAFAASGATATYDDVVQHLAMVRNPSTCGQGAGYIKQLDLQWSLRLARVIGLQNLFKDDRLNALTLYRSLYEIHGPNAVRPKNTHASTFLQLAYDQGQFTLAEELTHRLHCTDADLLALKADLRNPFTDSPYADADAWLALFNQNFESTGLEPVYLAASGDADDTQEEPFDRLRCDVSSSRDDGPLVTVVVSAWKPGHGLVTAVQSLLAQSHRHVEILVVDDCSPDEFQPLLEQVARLDARVRVLRQPVNGGTYLARNRALDEARGEFMTFLDSDDWSHPRRIEMQLNAMREDNRLIYTTTLSLRTHGNLVFNYPGKAAQRESATSLMFRIQPIRERVGYFDRVRKGADSEFAMRLRTIFGSRCYRVLESNLGMYRLSHGSLSREEFKPGWWHPRRAAYSRSYECWHRANAARPELLKTTRDENAETFPAPSHFLTSRECGEAVRRSHYDIVFVADMRHGEEVLNGLLDEVRACLLEGKRVGVAQMDSFRHLARAQKQSFWAPLYTAIADREVDEVLLTDVTAVDTVVVRDPEVLQFVSTQPATMDVGRVLIVAPYAPRDRSNRHWFDPAACHRHAQSLFETEVTWVPATSEIRKALAKKLDRQPVHEAAWPFVALSARKHKHDVHKPDDDAIVLGRIVDERSQGLPTKTREVDACYPRLPDFHVHMMGDRQEIDKRLGTCVLPRNWRFQDAGALTCEKFLRDCEFYVFYARHTDNPEASWDVLKAMATGCIVVTSPNHAGLYGGAAVYCEPDEVMDTLRRMHQDKVAANHQREAAWQYVKAHAGPVAFVEALSRIVAVV